MQVQPRLKYLLPKISHEYTNDAQAEDQFDCFGIHLDVPNLQYFKGGFTFSGNF